MNNKKRQSYDTPTTEIVSFVTDDLIATSSSLGWDEDNSDKNGWT